MVNMLRWLTVCLSFLNGVGVCNPYLIGTSFLIYFGINLLTSLFDDMLTQTETMVENWKQKENKLKAFDLAFSSEENKFPKSLESGKHKA